MVIPIYKKIQVLTNDGATIIQQLSSIEYAEAPVLLRVDQMPEHEEILLKYIESFMRAHLQQDFPYPVYVISSIKNYIGPLHVFSSVEKCPHFFNQKIKPLNIKEVNILNSIKLKQKGLTHIQQIETRPVISQYGTSHKSIAILNQEIEFLKNLNQKMEQ